jgi:O-antigen ligase
LALFILLPACFAIVRDSNALPFGRTLPDKFLAAYMFLTAILFLRNSSFTEAMRQTAYLFMDMFLPYFVISRSLRDLQTFKDALMSLVVAIMLVALLASFETYKQWLLYIPLINILELKQGDSGYLARDGLIRVMASAGFSISLGYLMVVGIGMYLFLQRSVESKLHRRLGMALLSVGLLVPWSRGPWVGAVLLLIVFIATGRNSVKRLLGLALVGMIILALLSILPGGERIINLLPIVGTTEKSTIDYRNDLITVSMIVIQRNLWFGSVNYLEAPEWEPLYQNHLIDIVNTYFQVALQNGLVALFLFVGFFVSVIQGLYKVMRSTLHKDSEEYLLGRALLATLLAILFIIGTVSNITIIPIVYWSVAGLGVAYVRIVRMQPVGIAQ